MEGKPSQYLSILKQEGDRLIYNRQTLAITMIVSNNALDRQIKKAYKNEKQAIRIAKGDQTGFEIQKSGLILFEGLIYVPGTMVNEVIKSHHD
jgi:hypothetical protein